MRNFVLGIVVIILVLLIGGLGVALLGFLPTRANTAPPAMEVHIAMSALDNSVDRHAPRRRESDRGSENLHHELRALPWWHRPPAFDAGEIVLSPASEPHPSPPG